MARACRHFGISRKTFYKWKRRHDDDGDAGLCDRPRAPHRSPRATPREVVSKILYLRQHYHFGPGRIADYLKRFHAVRSPSPPCIAFSEARDDRLPANQKHRRTASAGSATRSRSQAIACRWT